MKKALFFIDPEAETDIFGYGGKLVFPKFFKELEGNGIEVTKTKTVSLFEQALQKERFDIIVMGVRVSKEKGGEIDDFPSNRTGVALTKRIREWNYPRNANVPIFIITNVADVGILKELRNIGNAKNNFLGVFSVPPDVEEVINWMKMILEKKEELIPKRCLVLLNDREGIAQEDMEFLSLMEEFGSIQTVEDFDELDFLLKTEGFDLIVTGIRIVPKDCRNDKGWQRMGVEIIKTIRGGKYEKNTNISILIITSIADRMVQNEIFKEGNKKGLLVIFENPAEESDIKESIKYLIG